MRLIVFCLLLPCICFAQQTINSEQFFALGLSTYQKDNKPLAEEMNFPWIEQYEFRTETDEFDLDRQRYTFRLSPSTKKIRDAQKSIYDEIRTAQDFDGQDIYCDLVLSLHLDWLSLFILEENKKILDELAVVQNDYQIVHQKKLGSYDFDPEKLLKLRTEMSDAKIEMNELKSEADFLLNKYGIEDQELDFQGFLTVEEISMQLSKSALFSQDENSFIDPETEHEKELIQKELELELSEKKQLVDFIQVQYNGPNSDIIQEKLSIGMGFQLSNSGNRKLKTQELLIEKQELDLRTDRDAREKKEKMISLETKLKSDLLSYYEFQRVKSEESDQLKEISNSISQKEGTSPLLLLDIRKRQLSMELKSLKRQERLMKEYLKYIHFSAQMCGPDFINYLE